MIIGFVTLITIPLVIIYIDYTALSNEEIASRQLFNVAQKIADASESVYYLGEPSQTTLRVQIPNQVVAGSINLEREILFRMRSRTGISDIVQSADVNMTGSIPSSQGIYTVTIKAEGGKVKISYE